MKKHKSYKAFLSEILSDYIELPRSEFLCYHLNALKKAGRIQNPRYLKRLRDKIKHDVTKYRLVDTLNTYMRIENPEAYAEYIEPKNRYKLIQEYLKMKLAELE